MEPEVITNKRGKIARMFGERSPPAEYLGNDERAKVIRKSSQTSNKTKPINEGFERGNEHRLYRQIR